MPPTTPVIPPDLVRGQIVLSLRRRKEGFVGQPAGQRVPTEQQALVVKAIDAAQLGDFPLSKAYIEVAQAL